MRLTGLSLLLAVSAQASPFPSPTAGDRDGLSDTSANSANVARLGRAQAVGSGPAVAQNPASDGENEPHSKRFKPFLTDTGATPEDVLTTDVGLNVWDRLTNAQLLPASGVSRGVAASPPRQAHIRALLQCPLTVRESLFPSEFLDLDPANSGVLTLILGDNPSWRPDDFSIPEPLFVRQGRPSRTINWGLCLGSIAAAFNDPIYDPLPHVHTLRLLWHGKPFASGLGAGIQRIIRARVAKSNALRIEAHVEYVEMLTAVPAGSLMDLKLFPGTLGHGQVTAFFKRHGPFLRTISFSRDYLALRRPHLDRMVADGNVWASALALSTKAESLTVPFMTTDRFPPSLRDLTINHARLREVSIPFPRAACTATLRSLTVQVSASTEGFTAIKDCLMKSVNLKQLVVNLQDQTFTESAILAYQDYLRFVAQSRSITHTNVPWLRVGLLTEALDIPTEFPLVKHLTATTAQVTDEFLSRFAALTKLSLSIQLFGLEHPVVAGRGITHLDISDGGFLDFPPPLCEFAADRRAFLHVEHLSLVGKWNLPNPPSQSDVVKCFLDATHRPLRTINGIPVEELRAKFQRLAMVSAALPRPDV